MGINWIREELVRLEASIRKLLTQKINKAEEISKELNELLEQYEKMIKRFNLGCVRSGENRWENKFEHLLPADYNKKDQKSSSSASEECTGPTFYREEVISRPGGVYQILWGVGNPRSLEGRIEHGRRAASTEFNPPEVKEEKKKQEEDITDTKSSLEAPSSVKP